MTLSTGAALPAFLTYNLGAGTFVCATSNNSEKGTYTIRVRVTDNNSVAASNGVLLRDETFVLTVLPVNTAPVCTTRANIVQTTHSGSQSYTFSFSDVDSSDSLTKTLTKSDGSAIPSFVVLGACTTTQCAFTVNPVDNALAGAYTLEFKVTDNDSHSSGSILSCASQFQLTINAANDQCDFASAFVD